MAEVTMRLAKPVLRSFPVRGQTGAELVAALRAEGHAGTFYPNLVVDRAAAAGIVTALRISADPVIRLPDWGGLSKAEPELKKGWAKVLDLITRHEKGHHRDFVDRIGDFARAVRREAALTEAALEALVKDYKVRVILDRNALHERRLEADWRRIEKLLGV